MKKLQNLSVAFFSILMLVPLFFARDTLAGIPISEDFKVLASDGAYADYFGSSVSISGDHAIVGAYFDDDKGLQSGSAYIYHFDGTNWVEQHKLTASDGATSDFFGYSVSISGDHAGFFLSRRSRIRKATSFWTIGLRMYPWIPMDSAFTSSMVSL